MVSSGAIFHLRRRDFFGEVSLLRPAEDIRAGLPAPLFRRTVRPLSRGKIRKHSHHILIACRLAGNAPGPSTPEPICLRTVSLDSAACHNFAVAANCFTCSNCDVSQALALTDCSMHTLSAFAFAELSERRPAIRRMAAPYIARIAPPAEDERDGDASSTPIADVKKLSEDVTTMQ